MEKIPNKLNIDINLQQSDKQKVDGDGNSKLERLKTIANIISVSLVPVIIAISGYFINLSIKNKEAQVKLIELGIDILKTTPNDTLEGNRQLREWAYTILEQNSGVEFKNEAKNKLETEPLVVRPKFGIKINEKYIGNFNNADVGIWQLEHFRNSTLEDKITDVAHLIGELNTDLIGLIEADSESIEKSVEKLNDLGLNYDFYVADTRGPQKLAVIYNTNTTEITKNKTDSIYNARFANQLNDTTSLGSSIFYRKPLFTRCKVQENGKELEFLFILTHLKSPFGLNEKNKLRRKKESETISRIASELQRTEDIPVVLGGAFYSLPESNTLKALRRNRSLYEVKVDSLSYSYISERFKGNYNNFFLSKDITLSKNEPVIQLDQEIEDFEKRFSDHVPIVLRINYK